MDPTEEQVAILDKAKSTGDNLILNALAGCGKTSTLEMIERVVNVRPILYLVFNKKNAEEAEDRMLSTTTVRTFNSQGQRIWAKAVGTKRLSLEKKKTAEHLRELINVSPKSAQSEIWNVYWDVIHAVGLAKALGYIPEGKFTHVKPLISRSDFHRRLEEKPDDLTSDLIDALLTTSIKTAFEGYIDYNDQVYMPALFGGTYPNYPLVMADEAQDLNPVNHAILNKLGRKRTIAVGDPWQSIYGFRGATQNGMEKIKAHFNMSPLDLSVSFRCPQAVVEAARFRVPHFQWIKPGGHVEVLKQLLPMDIDDGSAIICRNNAPLFRVALGLLVAGRGVTVSGSDIGPKLVGIMNRLGPEDMDQASTLSAIDDWLVEKLAKESTTANDLADCMKVFANHGATLSQAISYAEHLFEQKGKIRLLTGHKAKGLEWDTVYHLDPWLCREDEQDQNLRYVITTRSKDKLFEIDSQRIKWSS